MKAVCILVVALIGLAAPTSAQEALPDSTCSRQECEITVSRSILTLHRFRQGGQPMDTEGPLGLGMPRFTEAVASSPEALRHANAFEHHLSASRAAYLGGLAALLVASALPDGEGTRDVGAGIRAAGWIAVVSSLVPAVRARISLNRAIRTYNESLP